MNWPVAHPAGLKQKTRGLNHAFGNLLTQFQLLGDRLVTGQVGVMQVVEQTAALANHHQKSTTRAVIFLVALQMLGQMVDALREQRDLHVCGTGVLLVRLECVDRLSFGFHTFFSQKMLA